MLGVESEGVRMTGCIGSQYDNRIISRNRNYFQKQKYFIKETR
jgi:hypothetical protein